MILKLVLAAIVVAVAAVAWQMNSASDGGSNPADATSAAADPTTPPSWIENPNSFLAEPQADLLLATGSAKVTGNPSIAHNKAMVLARMNLVKAKGTSLGTTMVETSKTLADGQVEQTVQTENPTTVHTVKTKSGETITFEKVDGKITGSQELASWTSPEGVLWVLVASGH